MQTKMLPKGRSVTTSNAGPHADASETPSRRKGGAAKSASDTASKPKLGKVTANGSPSTGKAEAPSSKRVKFSFSMPPVEREAIVALKHKLSGIVASKVKKSDIVRAGVLLLLSLPDAKLRGALGKIAAIDGGHHENGKHKK